MRSHYLLPYHLSALFLNQHQEKMILNLWIHHPLLLSLMDAHTYDKIHHLL
nr:MAG TPA: hypothetical protein [Caudoviricetes sp.]